MAKLFEGAVRDWKFVLLFCIFSLLFWLSEFAYQLYYTQNPNAVGALVRSFAFSSATFISLSLLSSAVFRFRPALLKYWKVRRILGVTGAFFMALHVLAVLLFVFGGDIFKVFYSLNPLENPLIFGAIALPIFLLVALISTDWAVQKLGAKWKAIQRLVYPGFLLIVFHFLLTNPPALLEIPGFLLLGISALALLGELFWFIADARQKSFCSKGTALGAALILLYVIIAYLAYFKK